MDVNKVTNLASKLDKIFNKKKEQTFFGRIKFYITIAILIILGLSIIYMHYVYPLFNNE